MEEVFTYNFKIDATFFENELSLIPIFKTATQVKINGLDGLRLTPEYDTENEYLIYDLQNDNWIITDLLLKGEYYNKIDSSFKEIIKKSEFALYTTLPFEKQLLIAKNKKINEVKNFWENYSIYLQTSNYPNTGYKTQLNILPNPIDIFLNGSELITFPFIMKDNNNQILNICKNSEEGSSQFNFIISKLRFYEQYKKTSLLFNEIEIMKLNTLEEVDQFIIKDYLLKTPKLEQIIIINNDNCNII